MSTTTIYIKDGYGNEIGFDCEYDHTPPYAGDDVEEPRAALVELHAARVQDASGKEPNYVDLLSDATINTIIEKIKAEEL